MVRKMNRMVWLCEFWGDINSWYLNILHKNLESWKKMEWNGMEWFVELESWKVWNNMEWNGMVWMVCLNMGLMCEKNCEERSGCECGAIKC